MKIFWILLKHNYNGYFGEKENIPTERRKTISRLSIYKAKITLQLLKKFLDSTKDNE